MNLTDIALMAIIAGGAIYLLYRSLWKKRGYCHGCSAPEKDK